MYHGATPVNYFKFAWLYICCQKYQHYNNICAFKFILFKGHREQMEVQRYRGMRVAITYYSTCFVSVALYSRKNS